MRWNESASNKGCPNHVRKWSGKRTPEGCQVLCVKHESECVGIVYSHKIVDDYCYLCKDGTLTSATNEYGFYPRPGIFKISFYMVDQPYCHYQYSTNALLMFILLSIERMDTS